MEPRPAFIELKTRHAQFHAAAAALVRKVDSGQSVNDDITVGSGSEFSKSTAAVVKALVKLRDEITSEMVRSAGHLWFEENI